MTFALPKFYDYFRINVQNYDSACASRLLSCAVVVVQKRGANAVPLHCNVSPSSLSTEITVGASGHFDATQLGAGATVLNIMFYDDLDPGFRVSGYSTTAEKCMTVGSDGRAVITIPYVVGTQYVGCQNVASAKPAPRGDGTVRTSLVLSNVSSSVDLTKLSAQLIALPNNVASLVPGKWSGRIIAEGPIAELYSLSDSAFHDVTTAALVMFDTADLGHLFTSTLIPPSGAEIPVLTMTGGSGNVCRIPAIDGWIIAIILLSVAVIGLGAWIKFQPRCPEPDKRFEAELSTVDAPNSDSARSDSSKVAPTFDGPTLDAV